MTPLEFEPAIPGSEGPQAHALERAANRNQPKDICGITMRKSKHILSTS
jgi:hypothetical protein